MTCIVGMTHKGKVYIGAGTLGSNGFTQSIRKESKVFKNGEFLIGCTSSFRMIDLLKWKFYPPTVKDDNLHKFMVTEFVDSVRKLFVDNGYCIEQYIKAVNIYAVTRVVKYADSLFNHQECVKVGDMKRAEKYQRNLQQLYSKELFKC